MKWKKISIVENKDNQLLTETRCCPVCDNPSSREVLRLGNFQFFSDANTPKQVDIIQKQCHKCGALFLDPCYSNEGFRILFEEAKMSYGSTEIRPTEQIEWLKKRSLFKKGDRVLDIGCGTGEFLASFPSSIKKVGVDIDAPSIQYAKSIHKNIEFICCDFADLEYGEDINLFTMNHVLEHLPNPKETLKRLSNLANEKTILLIEVPIIENGLTNDINGFFSAQHLTHFSRNSLKNIIQQSGWEIIEWSEQEDYNGCRVLAKKGRKEYHLEKSDLERHNLYTYFSYWYKSLLDVENKIAPLKQNKIIIWGSGMHLEFLYQTTSLFDKDREFIIVDSDESKQNKTWRGINIYNPSILKTADQNLPLLISSYGSQGKIEKAALELGLNKENIIKLYEHLRIY